MITWNQSSTARCKCVICGSRGGNSIVYSYVEGIEIKIPLCHKCQEIRSKRFDDNVKAIMEARLKQIKGDIHNEKAISFTDYSNGKFYKEVSEE